MPDLKTITDWVLQLGPEGLTLVVAFTLAYVLRRIPRVENYWAWAVAILLGVVLEMFGGSKVGNYVFRGGIGLVLSGVGAFAAIVVLHNKLAVALSDKWPALKFLVCDDALPETSKTPPTDPPKP